MAKKKINVSTPEDLEQVRSGEETGNNTEPAEPAERPEAAEDSLREEPVDHSAEAEQPQAQEINIDELRQAAQRGNEYLDALQRKQAEFENYRKRVRREQEELRNTAARGVLVELMDVADSFRRAFETSEQVQDPQARAFVDGMKLVEKKLWDVLSRHQVEHIPAKGEIFDPNRHEALMQQESTEHKDGEIIGVMREGYLLAGSVLRPAGVIVAKNPEASA